ncbi:hypothetical protein DNU06_00240 [Putridiphycobacter roseus]|uniref:Secretion system C-terminal sorting domain-containing protein n=1 Tax=Putridiphycobacter roseus TaxID=2219161 RepID=A0A2W1N116_9FLAO|nr:T9SS type A sorting domain-containing protein [Putridiphycobacter roseus]PZE18299.1 hypothetical protein DNU06_00240 [Putridiphycobacter roseus]
MKLSITIISLLISSFIFSQKWDWVREVNGLGNDYVSDVFIDDSANVYITGRSKYGVTFEDPINPIDPIWQGHTEAFAAKYDKSGNLLWANQCGGIAPDWGWGIVADNQGYTYFTGEFTDSAVFGSDTIYSNGDRDVFISKLDPNGNFIWTKTFGGTTSDKGKDIEMDNAGNLYITGFVGSATSANGVSIGTNGTYNGFIIKMDTAGNYLQVEEIAPKYSSGYHLKSDDNGHIYLTGETQYNNYFAGYLVTGPTTLAWRDAFILKMDTSLQVQWIQLGAGSNYNIGEGIAISDNYVYMTGCFSASATFDGTTIVSNGQGYNSATHNQARDIFIAKYDFSGNLIWVKGFGGIGYDYGLGVDVTSEDHVYLGGVFQDTVQFGTFELTSDSAGYDSFFTRLDTNGNVLWAKNQGGSLNGSCHAIAVDKYENVYAGGSYTTPQFDDISVTATSINAFIGKIVQHTEPQFVFNDTITCYGDTITLVASGITTPLSYELVLDQNNINNWQVGNTLYMVIDSNFTSTGFIVVSNHEYKDTILFTQDLGNTMVVPFSLGNDTIICDNEYLQLNAPFNNLYYDWSNNTFADSTLVSQAGTYWLLVSDVNGCTQSDTMVLSNFNTNAMTFDFGVDTSFCDNDSLLLTGPSGNFNYLWSTNQNTNAIYVNASNTYWLTVTDSNSCIKTDTINLTEFNTAGLNFDLGQDTSLCDYNVLDLSGPNGNYDYYWNTNESTSTIQATNTGQYWLTITDANGCEAKDSIAINYLECLGLNTIEVEKQLWVANGTLFINSKLKANNTLMIYNASGKRIIAVQNATALDCRHLASGIYIGQLQYNNKVETIKFMVQ